MSRSLRPTVFAAALWLVCERDGVLMRDLMWSLARSCVNARRRAIYLCHITEPGASFTSVAEMFGRDVAHVREVVARVEDDRDDPTQDADLDELEQLIVEHSTPPESS